jgi:hypothetical protein
MNIGSDGSERKLGLPVVRAVAALGAEEDGFYFV